jgi:predicted DNA binding CopG/RHH family protein
LFLTKQAFNEHIDIFKGLSLEKFYDILEYDEDDMDKWLVDYSVKKQDIEQALRNLSINLRELESDLFNIKIRHEINVAPMRSYIEEWLQREINKLTDEGQQAADTIPITVDESNKKASTNK